MLHSLFMLFQAQIDVSRMLTGVVLAVIIALVSYRAKFLTFGGSVATCILATIIYGIGGWIWTVPILTFFISSSLLSKVGKSRKRKLELVFDKTDIRDEGQVAANGGTAGIFVILWFFFPEYSTIYLLYTASLCAVAADTWATEIGTLAKGNPVSIVSFEKVEPGTNGGISFAGLISGMFGATIVMFSAWVVNGEMFTFDVRVKLLIASTVGSLIDSFLGATVQAQYKTEEGHLTEKKFHNGKPTSIIRGVRWITNDVVNWCCAFSGTLTMYLLM